MPDMSDPTQNQPDNLPSSLTDVKGWTRMLAGYGAAGIVAAWLLFKTVPDMTTAFKDELKAERDHAEKLIKDERDKASEHSLKSREHAKEVTKELADSIRGLTRTVEANQSAVRDNQWKLIDLQKKSLEAMKETKP